MMKSLQRGSIVEFIPIDEILYWRWWIKWSHCTGTQLLLHVPIIRRAGGACRWLVHLQTRIRGSYCFLSTSIGIITCAIFKRLFFSLIYFFIFLGVLLIYLLFHSDNSNDLTSQYSCKFFIFNFLQYLNVTFI